MAPPEPIRWGHAALGRVVGVHWHDLLTVSITNAGCLANVVNGVGGPTLTNTSADDLVSYP